MQTTSEQVPVFLTRTRGHFWSDRPAGILIGAVLGTQAIAAVISVFGIFMTPIGWTLALLVWSYALAWFLVNDWIKILAVRVIGAWRQRSVSTGSEQRPAMTVG